MLTTGGDGPDVTSTTRCPCRCKAALSDQLDHVGTVEAGRSPVSTLVPSLTTMVLFSMGTKG